AAEGIWSVDAAGQTTYVNPRMAEMLGYGVEEMQGCSLFDFVPDTERPRARELWERTGKWVEEGNEFCFRRKDGSDLWARCAVTSFYGEDGAFTGAFAMVTDVTLHKQALQALKASEQVAHRHLAELDAVIESMPDAVFIGTTAGITKCNKVALK